MPARAIRDDSSSEEEILITPPKRGTATPLAKKKTASKIATGRKTMTDASDSEEKASPKPSKVVTVKTQKPSSKHVESDEEESLPKRTAPARKVGASEEKKSPATRLLPKPGKKVASGSGEEEKFPRRRVASEKKAASSSDEEEIFPKSKRRANSIETSSSSDEALGGVRLTGRTSSDDVFEESASLSASDEAKEDTSEEEDTALFRAKAPTPNKKCLSKLSADHYNALSGFLTPKEQVQLAAVCTATRNNYRNTARVNLFGEQPFLSYEIDNLLRQGNMKALIGVSLLVTDPSDLRSIYPIAGQIRYLNIERYAARPLYEENKRYTGLRTTERKMDLDFLRRFPELYEIRVKGDFYDLDGLSSCSKLERVTLVLENAREADLYVLKKLPKLRYLKLDEISLRFDLEPLFRDLPSLEEISLFLKASHVPSFKGCPLKKLTLRNANTKFDLTRLDSALPLEEVTLTSSTPFFLAALEKYASLRKLTLHGVIQDKKLNLPQLRQLLAKGAAIPFETVPPRLQSLALLVKTGEVDISACLELRRASFTGKNIQTIKLAAPTKEHRGPLSIEIEAESIKELGFLAECPELEELKLNVTTITKRNLRVVGNCSQLRTLTLLDNNGITDFSFLRNLPRLEKLEFSQGACNNFPTDLFSNSPLLTDLKVTLSDSEALACIAHHAPLKQLTINGSAQLLVKGWKSLSNLESLAIVADSIKFRINWAMPQLRYLRLHANRKDDTKDSFACLEQACPLLQELQLVNLTTEDLSFLKICPGLTKLTINGNHLLEDLLGLENCPLLEELKIMEAPKLDFLLLSKLPLLRKLVLDQVKVSKLGELYTRVPALTALKLSRIPIEKMGRIHTLTQLTELSLIKCGSLTKIREIGSCRKLKVLELAMLPEVNLLFLKRLKLDWLSLIGSLSSFRHTKVLYDEFDTVAKFMSDGIRLYKLADGVESVDLYAELMYKKHESLRRKLMTLVNSLDEV